VELTPLRVGWPGTTLHTKVSSVLMLHARSLSMQSWGQRILLSRRRDPSYFVTEAWSVYSSNREAILSKVTVTLLFCYIAFFSSL
jgi:hypothetical protein